MGERDNQVEQQKFAPENNDSVLAGAARDAYPVDDNASMVKTATDSGALARQLTNDVAAYGWDHTLPALGLKEGVNNLANGSSITVKDGKPTGFTTAATAENKEGFKYTGVTFGKDGFMNGFTDPFGVRHERDEARSNGAWGHWSATKDGKPVTQAGQETEYRMNTLDSKGFHYWYNGGTARTSRLGDGGMAHTHNSVNWDTKGDDYSTTVTSPDGRTTWTNAHKAPGVRGPEVEQSNKVVTEDRAADKRITLENGKVTKVETKLDELFKKAQNERMVKYMANEITDTLATNSAGWEHKLRFNAETMLENGMAPADIAKKVNEQVQAQKPGYPLELKAGETKNGKTTFEMHDTKLGTSQKFDVDNKNADKPVKTEAEKALDATAKELATMIKNGDPVLNIGLKAGAIRKAFEATLDQKEVNGQRAVDALAAKLTDELKNINLKCGIAQSRGSWGMVEFSRDGKLVGSPIEIGKSLEDSLGIPPVNYGNGRPVKR